MLSLFFYLFLSLLLVLPEHYVWVYPTLRFLDAEKSISNLQLRVSQVGWLALINLY